MGVAIADGCWMSGAALPGGDVDRTIRQPSLNAFLARGPEAGLPPAVRLHGADRPEALEPHLVLLDDVQLHLPIEVPTT